MCDIQGTFVAKRIKTVFNVETKTIEEYINNIEYQIVKISNTQYLTKQTNLESGSVVQLMFFSSSDNNYFSTSDNGIDNMFYSKCGELIHNWSIPIDEENNIINAHAVLVRV